MKNIKLITILALSGAVLFGGKATAHKAKVNFKETVVARSESSGSIADLTIDSDKAIHGLQFDISYNPSEIKSIQPEAISGFEVKYNEISEGVLRGLIFSMQGHALPENLKFEFLNADGFEGTSTIEFKDIILADSKGNGVQAEVQTYDISFSNVLPIKTELTDAYPNPFNPSSTINYGLKTEGQVEIMVYDATGRLVEELINGHQDAGYHSITWNASNQASGAYLITMTTGKFTSTQKLMLVK